MYDFAQAIDTKNVLTALDKLLKWDLADSCTF